MRIAFVLKEFPSRSETFIFNQIMGIASLGHKVDIYAYKGAESFVWPNDPSLASIKKCVHYYHVPEVRIIRQLIGLKKLLANFLNYPVQMIKALNYFENKKHIIGVFRLLNVLPAYLPPKSFDIIHCHFGDMGLMAIRLKDIGVLQGKISTTFHGADMTALIEKRGIRLYQCLFEKGDLFLPVSQNWENLLLSWQCSKNKTHVHHMGVDTEFFKPGNKLIENYSNIKILSVCRLVPKKGISDAIKAVARVNDRHHKTRLQYVVVGDGPLRQQLQNYAKELGLSGGIVKFVGYKSPIEIKELLKKSHIFLAPSKKSKDGDMEGIPVSLMEAMAMGLTVLSTKHSGIPELVEDGVSGYLFAEGDSDAIAEKIVYLSNNPQEIEITGNRARKKIERDFNSQTLNRLLISRFCELLS